MAQTPIEILDLRRQRTDVLSRVVRRTNEIQRDYLFSILDQSRSTELSLAVHRDTNFGIFLSRFILSKTGWRGFHPYTVCLFDSAINNDGVRNLFTVDIAADGVAAVTLHNVAPLLLRTDQLYSYIVFQLAFFALKFSGGNLPFHNADRGCLFDYREKKSGIVDVIRGGHICDQCRTKLEQVGTSVSPSQLGSIYSLLETASLTFEEPPMPTAQKRPRVFIGSSTEGLAVARAIQSELEHDYEVEIWSQSNAFGLGTSTLEALENAAASYHFGIFVFTADDTIEMRDKTQRSPRDNVIFEAGLFIGKLGRYRSFIVKPRDITMQTPSDLHGITVADYDSSKSNVGAAVGAACTKLRVAIAKQLSL